MFFHHTLPKSLSSLPLYCQEGTDFGQGVIKNRKTHLENGKGSVRSSNLEHMLVTFGFTLGDNCLCSETVLTLSP